MMGRSYPLRARRKSETPLAIAKSPGYRGIFLIAVFDLIKAVFFAIAAVGVFHLVDRNTRVELIRLLHLFRVSGDHAFVRDVLRKANVVTDPDKRLLTGVLLLYSVLYAIEGIGLLLRKRWAEYFAVALTVIPLPFELRTLVRQFAAPHIVGGAPLSHGILPVLSNHIFVLKLVVLLINIGIIWYLIHHLRRSGSARMKRSSAAAG